MNLKEKLQTDDDETAEEIEARIEESKREKEEQERRERRAKTKYGSRLNDE